MFRSLKNFCNNQQLLVLSSRNLSSTEISTALRPFYFSVHPDLFGQHPYERTTNENSLKTLSSVLQTIKLGKNIRPTTLLFYVKDKVSKNTLDGKITFRSVKINIRDRDIRAAVVNILKTCNLETDYLDKIPYPTARSSNENIKIKTDDIDFTKVNQNHPMYAHAAFRKKVKDAQDLLKLKNWLNKNHKDALTKSEKNRPFKEEIDRLCKSISQQLGLKDIVWDCGWNDTHFRGCLLSFKSLMEQHPNSMHLLRGRVLVFSYFTGVSLDGHIMLFSGEVRNNWLDLIQNIRKYDQHLLRIPAFEKSLSHVLRDIKVGRRKFMPKIVAENYEKHLSTLTTSLSDYRGLRSFPKSWPAVLADYEIVVETEAGPLMLSPTGQFIVPCTLPGSLLVGFITSNLEEAKKRMENYNKDKHLEKKLVNRCVMELNLAALLKDDNITPDLMIKCCEKLLNNKYELETVMKNLHLNIASYYSVLSDGVVCIPWNFDL
ncbi:unnamed protein product [Brassicogethes aeneus]|uniref:T-cell activation inhibitor, mitochondrial n=1 Tax=Brassicogethes aeneus TaxID=1431903 RepID=A0A9P0B4G7_BRAAE|nr:unnamed protein product [Brassicogethes aeneus]